MQTWGFLKNKAMVASLGAVLIFGIGSAVAVSQLTHHTAPASQANTANAATPHTATTTSAAATATATTGAGAGANPTATTAPTATAIPPTPQPHSHSPRRPSRWDSRLTSTIR